MVVMGKYCIIEKRTAAQETSAYYTNTGMNYLYIDTAASAEYELSIMRRYEGGHKPKVFNSKVAAEQFIAGYTGDNKIGTWHVVAAADVLIEIAEMKLRGQL
jgi:hypothetical protein